MARKFECRDEYQRPIKEAVKMANAIYTITSQNATVKEALQPLK